MPLRSKLLFVEASTGYSIACWTEIMASPLSPTQPHIQSFDQFINESLPRGISGIIPQHCVLEGPQERIEVSFRPVSINIGYPTDPEDEFGGTMNLTPRACRECKATYSAPIDVTFECRVDGGHAEILTMSIGRLPIMVLSLRCHACL